MSNKRRIITYILLICMMLSLCACNGDLQLYKEPEKTTVSGDSSPFDSKPKAEKVKNESVKEKTEELLTDLEDGLPENGDNADLNEGDAAESTQESTTYIYTFKDYKGDTFEAEYLQGTKQFPYKSGSFSDNKGKKEFVGEGFISRFGIDVSKFQGDIDWDKVASSGVSFAFLRVGYRGFSDNATLNKDEKFDRNLNGALGAGIDVGVYFYSQAVNEDEAKEEAEYVLKLIGDKNIKYPIVLDEEYSDENDARANYLTKEQATKNAVAFCDTIEKAGYTPCIYVSPRWQAFYLDMREVEKYRIWYADYEPSPQTPYDFKFWQYSCKGRIDGINGDVDLNVEIINTENEARYILENMSVEEKTAQLFAVTPESLCDDNAVTTVSDGLRSGFDKIPVGGFILFDKNINDPDQVRKLNSGLLSLGKGKKITPFIMVDEEGGEVARIQKNADMNVDKTEYLSVIGMSKDENRAYKAGNTIGSYLNDLYFTTDLAPCADVLTNKNNQVVKNRSFGDDASNVSRMSGSYLNGLKDNGIIGCYKHFPGHGSTGSDSHKGTASTDKSYVELELAELVPFAGAKDNKVPMIMSGHINAPNVTKEDAPASMSKEWISDILRSKLGYDGVVITDALNMKAITEKYGADKAAVTAFKAGNDMLLMPEDTKEAYNALLKEIKDGSISEERLDESVMRILRLKIEYGIL